MRPGRIDVLEIIELVSNNRELEPFVALGEHSFEPCRIAV
jgi:hypothetical protein